jgi:hypothetical protein
MSDPLPMFDDPIPPVEPKPPKKPRQKPVRKARKLVAPKPVPKKRRKKRAPNKPAPTKEEVFLSPEVYKTIRTLVDLSSPERGMVMAIVKGLTNGRAD